MGRLVEGIKSNASTLMQLSSSIYITDEDTWIGIKTFDLTCTPVCPPPFDQLELFPVINEVYIIYMDSVFRLVATDNYSIGAFPCMTSHSSNGFTYCNSVA